MPEQWAQQNELRCLIVCDGRRTTGGGGGTLDFERERGREVPWRCSHFSISVSRKSDGAITVWKVNDSPRPMRFGGGVGDSFCALRTIRSLRWRICKIRSQLAVLSFASSAISALRRWL